MRFSSNLDQESWKEVKKSNFLFGWLVLFAAPPGTHTTAQPPQNHLPPSRGTGDRATGHDRPYCQAGWQWGVPCLAHLSRNSSLWVFVGLGLKLLPQALALNFIAFWLLKKKKIKRDFLGGIRIILIVCYCSCLIPRAGTCYVMVLCVAQLIKAF